MMHSHTERRHGSILLAAAAIWLIAVTLCSTRVVAEEHHENEPSGAHHHSASPGEHHASGCACSCDSFNSFPPQTYATNVVKAPLPAPGGPLFLRIWNDEIPPGTASISSFSESTGPPERLSFAELVLQRCRHNHAPPLLT